MPSFANRVIASNHGWIFTRWVDLCADKYGLVVLLDSGRQITLPVDRYETWTPAWNFEKTVEAILETMPTENVLDSEAFRFQDVSGALGRYKEDADTKQWYAVRSKKWNSD